MIIKALAIALSLAVAPTVYATGMEAAGGTVHLRASASVEASPDMGRVTLATEAENISPAQLARTIGHTLEHAIRIARGTPNIRVRSGGYHIYPITTRDQHIVRWRGQAGLVLKSTNLIAMSTLAGRLSRIMHVTGIRFSLSAAKRQRLVNKLSTRAVAAFLTRAKSLTHAFGAVRYHLKSASVNTQNGPLPRPIFAQEMQAASAAPALPLERGRQRVQVSVTGTIVLER